ncbi:hypothetical protein [Kribbella sp. NBC_00889]|nr:hypothetical protein OG817_26710 [Kribbella sp. NBC_00889]
MSTRVKAPDDDVHVQLVGVGRTGYGEIAQQPRVAVRVLDGQPCGSPW